ncbi:hypothetical protein [Halorussus amylolyticus]|uniref:hypothetical protein n=1 Tax=Halorussus amylolyticus TaxID=1126242 RepID=UPI001EE3ED09|nr:hypothetical protein [Halorussus amylolyticus]
MTDGGDDSSTRADDSPNRDAPLGDLADEIRSRAGEGERADDRPPRDGPLSGVASEVDERRRRRRATDDDPFESVEVGELDGEKLWEQLAEGDGDDGISVAVPPDEPDATGRFAGRDVRTIPKRTCHGCPHFGDPPELACTHEGTDILEMPDTDHFRVADCPMVVDETELGDLGFDADDDGE